MQAYYTYQNISSSSMSSLIIVVVNENKSVFIIAHAPTLKKKEYEEYVGKTCLNFYEKFFESLMSEGVSVIFFS